MKHIALALAAGAIAVAGPAAASAATLSIDPKKPCYRSGEFITLSGSGFVGPGVRITRDGELVGRLQTDASGAFAGRLKIGQSRGSERRTYTATDLSDPSLSASQQIVASAFGVTVRPQSGPPGRRLQIHATGFTTGRTLYAHVIRGRSKRLIKLGRLRGVCHNLRARKRILPRRAAFGTYAVQFDTFRKYRAKRDVSFGFSVNVSPASRGASATASNSWSRIF
jgi:hypothetical protein